VVGISNGFKKPGSDPARRDKSIHIPDPFHPHLTKRRKALHFTLDGGVNDDR